MVEVYRGLLIWAAGFFLVLSLLTRAADGELARALSGQFAVAGLVLAALAVVAGL